MTSDSFRLFLDRVRLSLGGSILGASLFGAIGAPSILIWLGVIIGFGISYNTLA